MGESRQENWLYKHGDQSSNPQYPCNKNMYSFAYICCPGAIELMRKKGQLGFTVYHPHSG